MNHSTDIQGAGGGLGDAYEYVPYDSQPFADSRPAYLGALGILCGLNPASPSRCRVLELGCASGGNLIPLAWYYPQAQFVGIDLSAAQIGVGQELLRTLGMVNCRLIAGDLTGIDLELESFDYVIAHGLYSWVPDSVRPAILALCRRVLRPGGIAYISYNTLPGWRSRLLTRDLLEWQLSGIGNPGERLAAAQTLVRQLAKGFDAESPGSYLEIELARIQSHPVSYLAHEYLEQDNEAFYFHQFVDDAAAAGLRYLCNADLATGFAELYGAMGEAVAALTDEPVRLEQYLDFVANRAFRQSLLCRDDEPGTEFDHENLRFLHLWTDLNPPRKLELGRAKGQQFSSVQGQPAMVYHPLCKALLALLADRHPNTMAYPELLDAAVARVRAEGDAGQAEDIQGALGELLGLIIMQHIEPLHEAVAVASTRSEQPRATGLARCQARLGWSHLATSSHRSLDLDPFARALVDKLDGSLDRHALCSAMLDWLVEQQSLDHQGRHRARAAVEGNVNRLLNLFECHGVMA